MHNPFSSRLILLALAAPILACSVQAHSAEMDVSAPSSASLSKALPALASALDSGAEKACSPTHLTVAGKAHNGSRLYASAPVSQFSAQLRKSAQKGAKLTRDQAHEIQRLVDYALQAQKTGTGMPQEAINQIGTRTGLSIQATMVCLSREQLSSP